MSMNIMYSRKSPGHILSDMDVASLQEVSFPEHLFSVFEFLKSNNHRSTQDIVLNCKKISFKPGACNFRAREHPVGRGDGNVTLQFQGGTEDVPNLEGT